MSQKELGKRLRKAIKQFYLSPQNAPRRIHESGTILSYLEAFHEHAKSMGATDVYAPQTLNTFCSGHSFNKYKMIHLMRLVNMSEDTISEVFGDV